MRDMKNKIIDAFTSKGINYSEQVSNSLSSLDKELRDAIPNEEKYFQIEEQISAVLADQEAEAWLYGFKCGIQLMIEVVAEV